MAHWLVGAIAVFGSMQWFPRLGLSSMVADPGGSLEDTVQVRVCVRACVRACCVYGTLCTWIGCVSFTGIHVNASHYGLDSCAHVSRCCCGRNAMLRRRDISTRLVARIVSIISA